MSDLALPDRRRRIWSDELLETVDRWGGIDDPPSPRNRKRREGIRIFRHDAVERYLSKAHPITPLFYALPFLLLGAWAGGRHTGLWGTLGLWAGGILLWTLVEYVLHRWIFHHQPAGTGGKMWSFMVHGYHHEFPDDRLRLVAPPLMVLFFGVIVGAALFLVFGPTRWLQTLAGLFTGYLAYDWIHYYTHHFHPRRGVGRWLRQYHLQHHFDPHHDRFGISSPLWDLIFRTYRSPGG
jgi:sterol desaturase/sphingolipid hydroxylase (fatty acid hydroxylase superfamily)